MPERVFDPKLIYQIEQLLIHIRREIYFVAVRSRGPGGQNVNKVSSAAVLHWPFSHSLSLTADQKNRLQSKMQRYLNVDQEITFRSDEFRDLEKNKKRCFQKLEAALLEAFFVPKRRRPTRPTRASQIKKRESKVRHSEIKALRKKIT